MATSLERGKFWRGYRRPVLRDGVFWFAMLVAVAGLAVQSPWAGWEGQAIDWVVLALEVVLTFAAAFIIIGVLAATARGFGQGWKEADDAARAQPAPAPTPTPTTLLTPEPRPTPAPDPTPAPAAAAPSDRPKAGVSMEKKARAFGRAVGAAKRTYKNYE